ncbi:endonuclease/exonuclease/phosphatase family protein [Streptomyces misionensis]|uniref:endonuclease/exonuclease/phosphatase family protein n=1 Tax=Streptomyces misionensis TaxID=67331 RepID=UPI0021BD9C10|nr:endonuclease/exonuclease/phosphatase family protein [Streptomyces misionensis]
MTWNLYLGGLDNGDDKRLRAQTEILVGLSPDVLCLQECMGWDAHDERILFQTADALGMAPVRMARSRIGDGRNYTALLYRPSSLRLMGQRTLGEGTFHHALIRARLRPVAAEDDTNDFVAFGTHFSWVDGDSRLGEARWMTDYGGIFPGVPPRALLLGDLNTPDREPANWSLTPQHLQSRYRVVLDNGDFGPADQRPVKVLLNSGWQDPQTLTGKARTATVGYWWDNEKKQDPWSLDYILTSGMQPVDYFTYDTQSARVASDHLPVVCDVKVGTHA